MIKRRSFLAGLFAAPAIAKSALAEVSAVPVELAEVIELVQKPPYLADIDDFIFRTADFPMCERVGARLQELMGEAFKAIGP